MTTINQLSSASTIDQGDLFALYSALNSDPRKVSFAALLAAIGSGLVTSDTIKAALGFVPVVAANKVLRYTLTGIALNSANVDVAQFTGLPAKYRVRKFSVYDAAAVPVAATLALYSAAAAGGTNLVAAATLTALTAASKVTDMTLAAAATTDYQTGPVLYARNVAANVAPLTVTLGLEIEDLT